MRSGEPKAERTKGELRSFDSASKKESERSCSPSDDSEPREDEPEDRSTESEVDGGEGCRVNDGEGEGEGQPDESVDEELGDGKLRRR